MLILTRKPGESLYIGDDIKITVVELKGHQVRVGIHAPPEMRIYREEIYLQILEENKAAAEAAQSADAGLAGLSAQWETKPATGEPAAPGVVSPGIVSPGSFHKAVLSKPAFSPRIQGAGVPAPKAGAKNPEVLVKRKPTKKPEND